MSGKPLSLHYQPKHNGIHGSNKEPRTGHQLAEERAETTAGMATGSETTLGETAVQQGKSDLFNPFKYVGGFFGGAGTSILGTILK